MKRDSPGQGSGLQFFITLSQPGQVPPYCSVTSLVLDLNIFPPPQDLSHCENLLHGPQTQGTKKNNEIHKKGLELEINILFFHTLSQ